MEFLVVIGLSWSGSVGVDGVGTKELWPKTPSPDLLTGQEPEPRKSSSKRKEPQSQ
jgi:hypothetical protein